MAEAPDLDAILERVREEAQRPEYQVPDDAPLAPLAAAASTPTAPAVRRAGSTRESSIEPPASVAAFLLLPDLDRFIEFAYERLLGRGADAAGAADYRARLAEGYGRTFVLAALAAAREPGSPGARLTGMGAAPLVYNLWRVLRRLGLGGVGRWLNGSYSNWRQRRAAGSDAALAQRAQELQTLDAAIAALRDHADEGLRGVDTRLGLLQETLARQGEQHDSLARKQGDEAAQLAADIAGNREATATLRRDLTVTRATARAARLIPRAAETTPATGPEPSPPDAALPQRIDAYYFAFEATHRGSEEAVRRGQRPYLEALATLPDQLAGAPVLDIGCGRGEWLALLREHGYAGRGADLSAAMVACCEERGLAVDRVDGVAALAGCTDASLAAVSAFHVIEHLPFETLFRFFEEAARAVAPGGLLLLETPNPENVLVGSHTFYHDFSHRNPVTPSALDFLASYFGFDERQLLRLNPYPPEARVGESSLAAERINGHFCGPQDLGLVARRASPQP